MLTARIWRERKIRYQNQAGRCKKCDKVFYPPRKVCSECRSTEMEIVPMATTGKVLAWTVIRVGPPGTEAQVPYVLAVLEMDDGCRMMTQLADVAPDEAKTGMRVRLEFRRMREQGHAGIISYGHKAVAE